MSARPKWPAVATAELPPPDGSIAALPMDARRRLAKAWAGRASAELGAATAFSQLTTRLLRRGTDSAIVWLASQAVADELRHAEICRTLASAFAGPEHPVKWPPPPVVAEPAYAGASPGFTTTLYVVHSCCVSETIGAAYLQGCLDEANGAMVRAGLRALLADEINHARIGWAFLGDPKFPGDERRELARALPMLLQRTRERWKARSPGWTDPVVGHGCMRKDRTNEVVDEALVALVLPGLEHVGVDTGPARRHLGELGVSG